MKSQLPSALNFTNLPSDRNPKALVSPASLAFDKVVRRAVYEGPNGFGTRSDGYRRDQDRFREAAGRGEEPQWSYATQPGAMILKQSETVREALRDLSAEDLQHTYVKLLCDLGPKVFHDWLRHPQSGKRSKWAPGCTVLEDTPRIFSF